MNSKDTRANSPAPLERGPLGFTPMTFEDPLAEFRERVVKAAAARCFLLEEGRSAADAVAEIVRRTYPDARRIASNLPEAAACATFNPDELEDPRSLAGTDVAIALLFIPEALVILLDRTQIVCTMHEAYSREGFDTYDFGSFIAGPSKTADIEQALVIGAHGPRDVSVILL